MCLRKVHVEMPFLLQDDFDPAFALLSEHVTAADTGVQLGAIMGLGLAYASTRREDVSWLLRF